MRKYVIELQVDYTNMATRFTVDLEDTEYDFVEFLAGMSKLEAGFNRAMPYMRINVSTEK